ncbi:MAG: phosphoenolpyruvate--protein phosphotransferase [Bacteroidota bacterium]
MTEAPAEGSGRPERVFTGIGVSPGVAIGSIYRFATEQLIESRGPLASDAVPREVARFDQAVLTAEQDLLGIASIAREKLGEESASIFEAQALMVRDESLYDQVVACIQEDRVRAAEAVPVVLAVQRRRMEASPSLYLRERAGDLLDIQQRLLRHLNRRKLIGEIQPHTLIVAQSVTAADLMVLHRRKVLGCALDFGGATSHVAIIARSLGLPAVMGLGDLSAAVQGGETLILDGFEGTVIVHPTPETVQRYEHRQRRYRRLLEDQKRLIPLPPETLDGHTVHLRANLELEEELPLLHQYNAQGIGLYRTEIQFMMRGHLDPTEEQLYQTYRRVVEGAAPHEVTFRLLDLGGDKLMPMPHREANPFLGWRGVRILLDRPDLLALQLRALLRASAHGRLRILVPMVTQVAEVDRIRAVARLVRTELQEDGHPVAPQVPLGIMVEVPAVALMIDHFARAVDFLAIGTNDLTQYALAVDRGNDLVAGLFEDMHPAVLHLIVRTVDAGRRHAIPVSLCGQLASNPRATAVLVGLGLRELSAPPSYHPEIKRVIRSLNLPEAEALAQQVLVTEDTETMHEILDTWLDEHACGFRQIFEAQAPGPTSSPSA